MEGLVKSGKREQGYAGETNGIILKAARYTIENSNE